MSVVTRGVKNAFRSGIRTTAVVLILAISMGVALSMLLANQAVRDRLNEVKQNVGTTVMIHPAGARGLIGGGEPLKNEDVAKVADVAHVSHVSSVLTLFLTTDTGDGNNTMVGGGLGFKQGKTNLKSSVDPGTIGKRALGGSDEKMPDFRLPLRAAGISADRNEQGQLITLTSGRHFTADEANVALIGKALAEENSLAVDSTFKAYDETFTVVGIFDEGTEFGNDAAYIPLATAQRLGEAGSEITSAVAIVDSIDNMESTTTAIKETLASKADVTATDPQAMTAVESLRSVEKVSVVGFVIALGAAGIIIFLTMLMIVRERRREIGVLKAIGGSNRTIVTQFVVEAMVLVLIGATVGMGVAAASSNGIANALVTSNSSEASDAPSPKAPSGGGIGPKQLRLDRGQGADIDTAKSLIGNVTTNISAKSLGYGLLAAIIIAVIGSAIPAWFITKIRPAEVLRGE